MEDSLVLEELGLEEISLLDGERLDSRRRAPYLGEHTATVLSELLGIDGAELAALAERRVAW